jgi:rod shape-determining protein MreC
VVREKRFVFWLLALIVVVLLNLPLSARIAVRAGIHDVNAPFQNNMSLVTHYLRSVFSVFGHANRVALERQQLEAKIAELQSRLLQLEQFEDENRTLRQQLGFAVLSPRKLLLCEVIERGDLTGWWHTLRLNKGSDAGVHDGMAVISTEGLVGRVTAVSSKTCDVLLIVDPTCKVACKVVRNGAFGIMQGAGIAINGDVSLEMLAAVKPCVLDYISTEHELRPNDVVLTSGLGNVFPEGLPVGRLSEVQRDPSGLYQQAKVIPSADIDRLKYAFVVLE